MLCGYSPILLEARCKATDSTWTDRSGRDEAVPRVTCANQIQIFHCIFGSECQNAEKVETRDVLDVDGQSRSSRALVRGIREATVKSSPRMVSSINERLKIEW